MENFTKAGRYFFATAVIGFGLIHFFTGNFPSALMPFPEFPGRIAFVYIIGLLLVLSGLSIITAIKSRQASLLLGLLLTPFLIVHFIHLLENIKNPGPWTAGGEILALIGGAWIVAGTFPKEGNSTLDKVTPFGKYLFVSLLAVVAVQHFMYAEFISFLIPEWMPARLFLAYFVGVVFVLTSVSVLINKQVRLSMFLLGIMFLIWVVILHAPRAFTNMSSEAEWTSLCVALASGGISFVLSNKIFHSN